MRIVIDTNVAISGLLWAGSPRRLIDHVRAGRVALCTSLPLVAELAEVIARPRFAGRLQAAGVSPGDLVRGFIQFAEIVSPALLLEPICRDPDDDIVIATALGANAELLVSGDDDLLVLRVAGGVPIVNVAEALIRIDPQAL